MACYYFYEGKKYNEDLFKKLLSYRVLKLTDKQKAIKGIEAELSPEDINNTNQILEHNDISNVDVHNMDNTIASDTLKIVLHHIAETLGTGKISFTSNPLEEEAIIKTKKKTIINVSNANLMTPLSEVLAVPFLQIIKKESLQLYNKLKKKLLRDPKFLLALNVKNIEEVVSMSKLKKTEALIDEAMGIQFSLFLSKVVEEQLQMIDQEDIDQVKEVLRLFTKENIVDAFENLVNKIGTTFNNQTLESLIDVLSVKDMFLNENMKNVKAVSNKVDAVMQKYKFVDENGMPYSHEFVHNTVNQIKHMIITKAKEHPRFLYYEVLRAVHNDLQERLSENPLFASFVVKDERISILKILKNEGFIPMPYQQLYDFEWNMYKDMTIKKEFIEGGKESELSAVIENVGEFLSELNEDEDDINRLKLFMSSFEKIEPFSFSIEENASNYHVPLNTLINIQDAEGKELSTKEIIKRITFISDNDLKAFNGKNVYHRSPEVRKALSLLTHKQQAVSFSFQGQDIPVYIDHRVIIEELKVLLLNRSFTSIEDLSDILQQSSIIALRDYGKRLVNATDAEKATAFQLLQFFNKQKTKISFDTINKNSKRVENTTLIVTNPEQLILNAWTRSFNTSILFNEHSKSINTNMGHKLYYAYVDILKSVNEASILFLNKALRTDVKDLDIKYANSIEALKIKINDFNKNIAFFSRDTKKSNFIPLTSDNVEDYIRDFLSFKNGNVLYSFIPTFYKEMGLDLSPNTLKEVYEDVDTAIYSTFDSSNRSKDLSFDEKRIEEIKLLVDALLKNKKNKKEVLASFDAIERGNTSFFEKVKNIIALVNTLESEKAPLKESVKQAIIERISPPSMKIKKEIGTDGFLFNIAEEVAGIKPSSMQVARRMISIAESRGIVGEHNPFLLNKKRLADLARIELKYNPKKVTSVSLNAGDKIVNTESTPTTINKIFNDFLSSDKIESFLKGNSFLYTRIGRNKIHEHPYIAHLSTQAGYNNFNMLYVDYMRISDTEGSINKKISSLSSKELFIHSLMNMFTKDNVFNLQIPIVDKQYLYILKNLLFINASVDYTEAYSAEDLADFKNSYSAYSSNVYYDIVYNELFTRQEAERNNKSSSKIGKSLFLKNQEFNRDSLLAMKADIAERLKKDPSYGNKKIKGEKDITIEGLYSNIDNLIDNLWHNATSLNVLQRKVLNAKQVASDLKGKEYINEEAFKALSDLVFLYKMDKEEERIKQQFITSDILKYNLKNKDYTFTSVELANLKIKYPNLNFLLQYEKGKGAIAMLNPEKASLHDSILLSNVIRDYAFNSFVGHSFFTDVFLGDLAQNYKPKKGLSELKAEVTKRLTRLVTPITNNADPTPSQVLYFEDVELPDIEDNDNATDATEYVTVIEKLRDYVYRGKYNLTFADLERVEQIIANAQEQAGVGNPYTYELPPHIARVLTGDKGVTVEYKISPITGALEYTYNKSSEVVLHPGITTGNKLEQVRMLLEKNKVGRAVFASAHKMGTGTFYKLFNKDKDGNIIYNTALDTTALDISTIERKGIGIQNFHKEDISDYETLAKQLSSIVTGYIMQADDRASKATLEALNTSFYSFFENALTNDEYIFLKNPTRYFLDLLSSNYLTPEQLELLKKKDIMPFFNEAVMNLFPNINSKVHSLFTPKMPGRYLKQMSSLGLEYSPDTEHANTPAGKAMASLGVLYMKGHQSSERLRSLQKGKPGEILTSFNFKDKNGNSLNIKDFMTYDEETKRWVIDNIDEEALQGIAVRIPAQGYSSMHPTRIVGFLPGDLKDKVAIPAGFTKQMGSDFDGDALFVYNKRSVLETPRKSNNKEVTTPRIKIRDDNNPVMKTEYEYFNSVYNLLMDEGMISSITRPLENNIIKEFNDKLKEKDKSNMLDGISQVTSYLQNKESLTLVGIFAMQTQVASILSQFKVGDYQLTTPLNINGKKVFSFTGEGFTPLINGEGEHILYSKRDIIGAFLTEAVDYVKNMNISHLNINENSVKFLSPLLLLQGETKINNIVPLREVIAIMTSPLMIKIVQSINSYTNSFSAKYKAPATYISEQIEEAIVLLDYIKKIKSNKNIPALNAEKKTVSRFFAYLKKNKKTFSLNTQDLYNDKFLNDASQVVSSFVNGLKESKNFKEEKEAFVKDLQGYINTMIVLQGLHGLGTDLLETTTKLNIFSKGLKEKDVISFMHNQEHPNNSPITALLNTQARRAKFKLIGTKGKEVVTESPLFKKATDLKQQVSDRLIDHAYPKELLEWVVAKASHSMNFNKLDIKTESIRLQNELLSYIKNYVAYTAFLESNAFNTFESFQGYKHSLLFGNNENKNIGLRVLDTINSIKEDLTRNLPEDERINKEKQLYLLRSISVQLYDNRSAISFDGVIWKHDNGDLLLTEGYIELYRDKNTYKLAKDMLYYSFLFDNNDSINKISKVIPHSIVELELNMSKAVNGFLDEFTSKGIDKYKEQAPPLVEDFLQQFFQNNISLAYDIEDNTIRKFLNIEESDPLNKERDFVRFLNNRGSKELNLMATGKEALNTTYFRYQTEGMLIPELFKRSVITTDGGKPKIIKIERLPSRNVVSDYTPPVYVPEQEAFAYSFESPQSQGLSSLQPPVYNKKELIVKPTKKDFLLREVEHKQMLMPSLAVGEMFDNIATADEQSSPLNRYGLEADKEYAMEDLKELFDKLLEDPHISEYYKTIIRAMLKANDNVHFQEFNKSTPFSFIFTDSLPVEEKEGVAGLFSIKENKIYINNANSFDLALKTLLHEYGHAISVYAINMTGYNAYRDSGYKAKGEIDSNSFNRQYPSVLHNIATLDLLRVKALTELKRRGIQIPDSCLYAFTSVEEFIAELYSNSDLKDLLSSINVPKEPVPTTFLNKVFSAFLKLIKDFIGIGEREATAFDEAFLLLNNLNTTPEEVLPPDYSDPSTYPDIVSVNTQAKADFLEYVFASNGVAIGNTLQNNNQIHFKLNFERQAKIKGALYFNAKEEVAMIEYPFLMSMYEKVNNMLNAVDISNFEKDIEVIKQYDLNLAYSPYDVYNKLESLYDSLNETTTKIMSSEKTKKTQLRKLNVKEGDIHVVDKNSDIYIAKNTALKTKTLALENLGRTHFAFIKDTLSVLDGVFKNKSLLSSSAFPSYSTALMVQLNTATMLIDSWTSFNESLNVTTSKMYSNSNDVMPENNYTPSFVAMVKATINDFNKRRGMIANYAQKLMPYTIGKQGGTIGTAIMSELASFQGLNSTLMEMVTPLSRVNNLVAQQVTKIVNRSLQAMHQDNMLLEEKITALQLLLKNKNKKETKAFLSSIIKDGRLISIFNYNYREIEKSAESQRNVIISSFYSYINDKKEESSFSTIKLRKYLNKVARYISDVFDRDEYTQMVDMRKLIDADTLELLPNDQIVDYKAQLKGEIFEGLNAYGKYFSEAEKDKIIDDYIEDARYAYGDYLTKRKEYIQSLEDRKDTTNSSLQRELKKEASKQGFTEEIDINSYIADNIKERYANYIAERITTWDAIYSPLKIYDVIENGVLDANIVPSLEYTPTVVKRYNDTTINKEYIDKIKSNAEASTFVENLKSILQEIRKKLPLHLRDTMDEDFLPYIAPKEASHLLNEELSFFEKGIKSIASAFAMKDRAYDKYNKKGSVMTPDKYFNNRPRDNYDVNDFFNVLTSFATDVNKSHYRGKASAVLEGFKMVLKDYTTRGDKNSRLEGLLRVVEYYTNNLVYEKKKKIEFTSPKSFYVLKKERLRAEAIMKAIKEKKEQLLSLEIALEEEKARVPITFLEKKDKEAKLKQLQETINNEYKERNTLYSELTALEGERLHGSASVALDAVNFMSGIAALGWNISTALANFFVSVYRFFNLTTRGLTKLNFGAKTIALSLPDIASDALTIASMDWAKNKKIYTSRGRKIERLSRLLDIVHNSNELHNPLDKEEGAKSMINKGFGYLTHSAYFLIDLGDRYIKKATMVTFLEQQLITILNKKTNKLEQVRAWDLFDNKGVFRSDTYGYEGEDFTKSDIWLDLQHKLQDFMLQSFGNQNKRSPIMAKQYAVGRLVSQFKTSWLPELVKEFFGTKYKNSISGQDEEGYVITLWNLIFKNRGLRYGLIGKLKDILKFMTMDMMNSISTLGGTIPKLRVFKEPHKGLSFGVENGELQTLSERQQGNLYVALKLSKYAVLLPFILSLLKDLAGDDDDKESGIYAFLAFYIKRIFMEETSVTNPLVMYNMVIYHTPSLNWIYNLYNSFIAQDVDEKVGKNKKKLLNKRWNLIPGTKFMDFINPGIKNSIIPDSKIEKPLFPNAFTNSTNLKR